MRIWEQKVSIEVARGGHLRYLVALVDGSWQLLVLCPQARQGLSQLAARALELRQLQNLPEIGGKQAFLLAFNARDGVSDRGLPRLHLLG